MKFTVASVLAVLLATPAAYAQDAEHAAAETDATASESDEAKEDEKWDVNAPKGATIKAVGQASREELQEFLGRKVHLFLTVKVRPGWLDEAERYSEIGLDFRDGEG